MNEAKLNVFHEEKCLLNTTERIAKHKLTQQGMYTIRLTF